jgi:hypothetical protein
MLSGVYICHGPPTSKWPCHSHLASSRVLRIVISNSWKRKARCWDGFQCYDVPTIFVKSVTGSKVERNVWRLHQYLRIWRRTIGRLMIKESEMVWKETDVAWFEVPTRRVPQRAEEDYSVRFEPYKAETCLSLTASIFPTLQFSVLPTRSSLCPWIPAACELVQWENSRLDSTCSAKNKKKSCFPWPVGCDRRSSISWWKA